MSSKMSIKTSRKDRPRSSVFIDASDKVSIVNKLKGRKRDGTPEKSQTPSQDAMEEAQASRVIWNEEIEKLQIKKDDLEKLRTPKPPSAERRKTPVTSSIAVRKMRPLSELDKPKAKTLVVAKPAPHDAAIKPLDYSGFAGPRYDEDGNVIPHSILGSYDEFKREAIKRGDLLDFNVTRFEEDSFSGTPTLKYEKKKHLHDSTKPQADESNALKNWQRKMLQRKRQQGYISNLLDKAPEDLVMNQPDNYRKIQEDRYIIDRTIPAVDYGKGYRVRSEFWKQQEQFGDEETGVHMTLTQTERGYPPPIEHVGIPNVVRDEKAVTWDPNQPSRTHYPWHKSPYLAARTKQLKPLIDELDPHLPEFGDLQIVGTSNPRDRGRRVEQEVDTPLADMMYEETASKEEDLLDPLRDHPDVHPEPIFGPSIKFAGQPARWTGDSYKFQEHVGIEARVTFESFAGDRITSYLEIINDGTTSIYYDWKKIPKENSFDMVQAPVQRFYFNNGSGVILPGDTMKFPFVFKSPNPGVFSEQWKFETRPVVCGGAALVVTLRGIALQEDKFQKERQEIERDLEEKQTHQVVTQMLYDIIDGIRTPDRARSPIDAYITEEETFARHNPGLNFHHDSVEALKKIFRELKGEDETQEEWDLSIENLKNDLMAMDEDDERKEVFLEQMNNIVGKMSFIVNTPVQQQLYQVGYQKMIEAVDQIVGQSMLIRTALGLPDKEADDLHEDFGSKAKSDKSKPDSRKGAAAKDAKSGKSQGKGDAKGKSTPGPKKPPSRTETKTPGASIGSVEPRSLTPTSQPQSPVPDQESQLEKKYKEKLALQAYVIMQQTVGDMADSFEAIIQNDLGRHAPNL